jgi:hypothetical protein
MRTERHLRRARAPRTEGAVYVEALLVLGTFILLLALILFVHDGFAKASVAGTETRGHGWVHAMEPCQNDVPAPTEQRSEGAWGAGGAVAALSGAASGLDIPSFQGAIIDYWDLLTFRIDGHRFSQSARVERPVELGGEARYGHQIVLTCDEDLDAMEMQNWKFGVWTMTAWEQAGL